MSVRAAKKQAKELFYKDMLTHIGAYFAVAVSSIGFSCACLSMLILAYNYTNLYLYSLIFAVLGVFQILLIVPLYYGLFVFEYNAVHEGKHDIKNIFYAFSSTKVYARSFFTAFALLWRFLAVFLLPILVLYEFWLYLQGKSMFFVQFSLCGYDVTYTFILITFAFTFIISSLYFSRYFTTIYLIIENEDKNVLECFFTARIYNRKKLSSLVLMTLSFVPLAIISVLTFGILFIIYAIPIMLLSYFCMCKSICENEKINKLVSEISSEIQNDY